MASRDELLQSIRPDMKITKNLFMQIYGYTITDPGFKDIALQKLRDIGCGLADTYYSKYVSEYEERQQESMREASQWYVKQLDEKYKKKEG